MFTTLDVDPSKLDEDEQKFVSSFESMVGLERPFSETMKVLVSATRPAFGLDSIFPKSLHLH